MLKKSIFPHSIYTILFCLLSTSNVIAQDSLLYRDGLIYLKISDNSNVQLSLPGTSSNPPRIEQLFSQYQVTNVSKPFAILGKPKFNRYYAITFQSSNANGFVQDLGQEPIIDFAERAAIRRINQIIPNDPSAQNPSVSNGNSYQLELSKTYLAFEENNSGGALIAIIDNAINTIHEDLNGNYVFGLDVTNGSTSAISPTNDGNWDHGTHVAGIACGRTNNSIGIASPGWNNQLFAIKATSDNSPSTDITHSIEAIAFAVANNVKVINMSYGGDAYNQAEYDIIEEARAEGIIVVAAAGNANTSNPLYPAAYGEGVSGQSGDDYDRKLVIAVASIDENNTRSLFSGPFSPLGSNFGPWVDIAAYGNDVYSCSFGNSYKYASGTSMAAPLVAGIAGLMIDHAPNSTVDEIIDCLIFSANTDIYDIPTNIQGTLGSGRIDAHKALLCISPDCANPVAVISSNSQTICANGSEDIILTANTGIGYAWSTGATTKSITITQPGTYSVTVTFSGGCTATTSTTLEVVEPTILAFSDDGSIVDGPLCGHTYVTISAYWGNSYQWISSTGFPISTSSALFTSNGTNHDAVDNWQVMITDVGNCVGVNATLSIELTYFEEPVITIEVEETSGVVNDGLICSGSSASVVLTAEPISPNNDTYLWSNGGTTQTTSGILSSTTTYFVTVTNANGCEATQDATIQSVACPNSSCFCPGNNNLNIGIDDGQIHNLSNLINSQTSLSGRECLSIKGRVRINVSNSILNSNVYFHPGAELIIPSGKKLTIWDSHLASCSNMWRGITVESGGTLEFKRNEIRDAQFAIKAEGGTNLEIRNNLFDRNFVGFYVPSSQSSINVINLGLFEDNKMSCSSNLASPYVGQLPAPGSTTYAGVLINNLNHIHFWQCIFEDLKNGILSYNSDVTMQFSKISNLVGEHLPEFPPLGVVSSESWDYEGLGIFASDSDNLDITESDIENCFYGVVAHSSYVFVVQNNITDVKYGVHVFYGDYNRSHVTHNTISCDHTGIGLYYCDLGDIRITNNSISSTGDDSPGSNMVGIGIYSTYLDTQMSGNVFNNGGVANIEQNYIRLVNNSLIDEDRGIEISFCSYVKLQGNEIESYGAGSKKGIYLEGNSNCQVRENYLYDQSPVSFPFEYGLFIINSPSVVYCCNEIYNFQKGIKYIGMATDTKLRGNTLNTAINGLEINANSFIGTQGDPNTDDYLPGNKWYSASAYHGGSLTAINLSRIYFNPNISNTSPTTTNPSFGWFNPSTVLPTIDCNTSSNCNINSVNFTGELPPGTDIDIKIADGTLATDVYDGGIQWEGERYLYRKVANNYFSNTNATISSFYNAKTSQSVGLFTNLDLQRKAIYSQNSSLLSQISNKRNEVISVISLIRDIDNALSTTPESENSVLLQTKAGLIAQLGILTTDLRSNKNSFNAAKVNVAASLSNQNNNIATPKIYEQNQKTINNIHFNALSTGSTMYYNSQLAQISDIANQCALSGGNAVFHARGMLKLMGINNVYDDEQTCVSGTTIGGHRNDITTQEKANKGELLVYPNPATLSVNININSDEDTSGKTFKLFDLTGKEVASYILSKGERQFKFDVSQLQTGIYFYECLLSNTIYNGKIIIANN